MSAPDLLSLDELVEGEETLTSLAANFASTSVPTPVINPSNEPGDKLLSKIQNTLSEIRDLITTHQVHTFGEINIHERKNSFVANLQKLRWIVQQHKRWSSEEKEAILNRYLNLLKDQMFLENISEQLKNSLDDSQQLGQKHLFQYSRIAQIEQTEGQLNSNANNKDNNNSNNNNNNMYQQYNLLQRVQQISEQLELQYFVEYPEINLDTLDDLMDVGEQYTTASLSSPSFLIDVLVTNKGQVHAVKLTFVGEDDDTNSNFDNDLTNALRTNIDDFKKKVSILASRDILYRTYSNVDVKSILKTMETDIINIYNKYKNALKNNNNNNNINLEILNYHYGIPQICTEGLKLYYYVSPFNLIDTPEISIKEGNYLLLALEQGDFVKHHSLPVTSQLLHDNNINNINNINNNNNTDNNSDINGQAIVQYSTTTTYVEVPIQFVFFCTPYLYISIELVQKINNIIHGNSQPQNNAISTSIPNTKIDDICLELCLIREKKGTNTTIAKTTKQPTSNTINTYQNEMNINGMHFKFVYNKGMTTVRSIKMERIPFVHIRQIDSILKLLRQQLVFNELFQSCFANIDDTQHDITEKCIGEIICDAPYYINISFYHQKLKSLVSMRVTIDLNGIINCTLQTPNNCKPPCTNHYVTQLMERSHSIPFTLLYVCKKP